MCEFIWVGLIQLKTFIIFSNLSFGGLFYDEIYMKIYKYMKNNVTG